jgi:hypothetical protein
MALRKKSRKISQPLWRPDFRDVQELPDTKAVRTGFLLNFVAIVVTLGIGIFYAFKEYSLQSVLASLDALETQVEEGTPADNRILKANQRFQQTSRILSEVIAFDRQQVDFPELIRDIAAVRPSSVILSRIDILTTDQRTGRASVPDKLVQLTGRIEGAEALSPSEVLSQFRASLAEMPSMEGRNPVTDLTRFNRNNEFGHFDFTLKINIPFSEEGGS